MVAAICVLLLSSFLPPPSAEVLSGDWWVQGNGTHGQLSVNVDSEGRIGGSIYGQPIDGTFDSRTGKLEFKRFRDSADREGIQLWVGELTFVEGSKPPTYRLAGTFSSIAGPEFGADGKDYDWSTTAVRHPAPSVDLKEMQGKWKVASVISAMDSKKNLPDSLGIIGKETVLEFQENRLMLNGKMIGTIANDLKLSELEEEIGFMNFRLCCLSLPDGTGFMCSYQIQSDGIEIAYPFTTSCHRGSGNVLKLKRPN